MRLPRVLRARKVPGGKDKTNRGLSISRVRPRALLAGGVFPSCKTVHVRRLGWFESFKGTQRLWQELATSATRGDRAAADDGGAGASALRAWKQARAVTRGSGEGSPGKISVKATTRRESRTCTRRRAAAKEVYDSWNDKQGKCAGRGSGQPCTVHFEEDPLFQWTFLWFDLGQRRLLGGRLQRRARGSCGSWRALGARERCLWPRSR